jgi:ubiquinone/menaquinone biosynthesis C-methylase UbiE
VEAEMSEDPVTRGAEFESELAAYFDRCAREGDMAEFDHDERRRLDGFLRAWRIRTGDSVLEPGCGAGRLTEVLAEVTGPSGRVLAVDLSPEMVARARARVLPDHVAVIEGSVLSVPASDGSFDKVICLNVYPHFADPAAALREFARVLRRGGELWINHFASRDAINEFHASLGPVVQDHLIPPDDEVHQVLRESGFEVVSHEDDDPGYRLHARKK